MSEEGKSAMDRDQLYHNLELRYMTLQQDAAKIRTEKESLQKRVTESDEALAAARSQVAEMKKAVATRDASVAEKQRLVEAKEHENKQLLETLHRANKDVETQKELRLATDTHVEDLEKKLSEVRASFSELSTKQVPLLIQVERLTGERDAAQEKIRWLEGELNSKVTELMQERKKTINLQIELQGKLDRAEKGLSESQERVSSLQSQLRARDQLLDQRTRELKEEQHKHAKAVESFDAELIAQRRLVSMHETNAKEAQAKAEALHKALKSAEQAYDEQVKKLRSNLKSQAEDSQRVIDELAAKFQKRIEDLEKELKTATDKGAAPSASAASTAPRSMSMVIASTPEGGGLTTLEMYDKVVELERALGDERAEKRKLQIYVDRVVKEIESKAPVLAAHKRDYHRALVSHEQLQSRLEQAMVELRQTKQTLTAIDREREELIAEKRQHDEKVHNLSRQIHLLLRNQVQSSTGRQLLLPSSEEGGGQQQGQLVLSSSSSIDESLITFRDIQELQKRNLQLQTLTSKLQRQLQSLQESGVGGDGSGGVSDRLMEAQRELDKLARQRQEMEATMTAIANQRDMYRILLAQADSKAITQQQGVAVVRGTSSIGAAEAKATSTPTPTAVVATTSRTQETVREVQLEAELREEQGKLSKIQELYHEAVQSGDKLRSELSSVRGEGARAAAEARFLQDRLDMALKDAERAKEEFQKAQAKVTHTEATSLSLEKMLQERGVEVDAAKDEARRLHTSLQQAHTEREIALASERRLEAELSSKRAEVESLSKLVDTVNKLEASVGAKAEAEHQQWENERRSLQAQIIQAKKDANEVRAISEDRLNSLSSQVKAAKDKEEQDAKTINDLQNEVNQLKVQLKAAQDKASLFEKQLDLAQRRLDGLTTSGTASAIAANEAAEKEMEVERLTADLQALQERLSEAERHRAQYQAIAAANDKSLKEVEGVLDKVKAEAASDKQTLQGEVGSVRRQLQESKKVVTELLTENQAVKEEASKDKAQHKKEVADLTAKLEEAKKVSESVVSMKASLTKDVERARDTAKMATDNYDRELQLHAAARAKLSDLQTQLDALRSSKNEADDRVASLEADLANMDTHLKDERKRFEEQSKAEKARVSELEKQNSLLHSSLQSITSQLERLQAGRMQALEAAGGGGATEGGAAEAAEVDSLRKSMVDLQEVVAYFRREKELADANKQVAEMEAARHRTTVQQLQKLLDQARAELEEERKLKQQQAGGVGGGSGGAALSESEHNALMAQVQQLNLMRESNALLRQEKVRAEGRVKELEGEVGKLREAMDPLKLKDAQAQAHIRALKMDKEALENEVKTLNGRIQTLISRFHQIDPEEHRQLQVKTDALTKRIEELESQHKKRVEELEGKVKEVEQSKQATIGAYSRRTKTLMDEKGQLDAEVQRLKATLDDKAKEAASVDARASAQRSELLTKKEEELTAAKTELQEVKEASGKVTADLDRCREGLRKAVDKIKRLEPRMKEITALRAKINELCTELGRPPLFPQQAATTAAANAVAAAKKAGESTSATAMEDGGGGAGGEDSDSVTTTTSNTTETPAPLAGVASTASLVPPVGGAGRGRRVGGKRAPPQPVATTTITTPVTTQAAPPQVAVVGAVVSASGVEAVPPTTTQQQQQAAALRLSIMKQQQQQQAKQASAGGGGGVGALARGGQVKRPASGIVPGGKAPGEGKGGVGGAGGGGAVSKKAKVTPTTPSPPVVATPETIAEEEVEEEEEAAAAGGGDDVDSMAVDTTTTPAGEGGGASEAAAMEEEEQAVKDEEQQQQEVEETATATEPTTSSAGAPAAAPTLASSSATTTTTPATAAAARPGATSFGGGATGGLSAAAPSFAPPPSSSGGAATRPAPVFSSFGAPSLLKIGGGTGAPVFGSGAKPTLTSPFGAPTTTEAAAAPPTQHLPFGSSQQPPSSAAAPKSGPSSSSPSSFSSATSTVTSAATTTPSSSFPSAFARPTAPLPIPSAKPFGGAEVSSPQTSTSAAPSSQPFGRTTFGGGFGGGQTSSAFPPPSTPFFGQAGAGGGSSGAPTSIFGQSTPATTPLFGATTASGSSSSSLTSSAPSPGAPSAVAVLGGKAGTLTDEQRRQMRLQRFAGKAAAGGAPSPIAITTTTTTAAPVGEQATTAGQSGVTTTETGEGTEGGEEEEEEAEGEEEEGVGGEEAAEGEGGAEEEVIVLDDEEGEEGGEEEEEATEAA